MTETPAPDPSSLSPEEASPLLTKALEMQLQSYNTVLQLAQQQQEIIQGGQTEPLMEILAQKQRKIGQIDALQRTIAPLKDRWDREGDTWSASLRAPIEAVVQKLRDTLAQIVALEDQGRESLTDASKQTGQKITHLQKGKAMHKAYGGTGKIPPPANFKDRNA